MLDGAVIDVAIGVLLLFLVSSLAASAIVETVGGYLHRRSKNLWDTIDLMLGTARDGDGRSVVDRLYRQPFITALVKPTSRVFFEPDGDGEGSAPMRGAMMLPGREMTDAERKRRFYGPQAIEARDFADALIEVVRPGGTADRTGAELRAGVAELDDGPLKVELHRIVGGTGDTLAEARSAIEEWYERYMTSVSLWYRRQTRWFLFLAGLVMAVTLNLDAVDTAVTLYRDEDVRTAVVAQAETLVVTACDVAETAEPGQDEGTPEQEARDRVDCVRAELDGSVALPVGWGDDVDTTWGAWVLRLLGWIVVAGSVTLGAPFWFDLLGRALRSRRTG